jgi:lysophospholipase L1-like esterase
LAVSAGLVTLAVVGAGGEWAVRHRERTRSTVPGTMSMLFYRHQRLMHGLVRGMDYYGWVHISRQGFRGTGEVSQIPADSVIRIIAVGGSTTFDGNVSGDSSAWPARLEAALNAATSPGRYEVLNAGVPGFQVFDDLVRLESELHWYQPAIILLYQGHNDLFNTLGGAARGPGEGGFDARPDEIPTVYPWERWLEHHSLLFHKLGQRLQAIQFRSSGARQRGQTTAQSFDEGLGVGVERFARQLRAYLAVAQSLGIQVIVPQVVYAAETGGGGAADSVVEGWWRGAMPFAPAQVVWSGYARYDSVARAAAGSFGALYVPARDSTLWSLDHYTEGDPVHFNDRGSRAFAEHLAGAIIAMPARHSGADSGSSAPRDAPPRRR